MKNQLFRLFAIVALAVLPSIGMSQDQLDLPPDEMKWFLNRFGDCVQCSISMTGMWQNVPQASTLLYKTEYGNAELRGSGPSRVEAYAERRGIALYNVTGKNTWDWMKWASRTGRMSAIGCFSSHFQTLLWYDPDPNNSKPWCVKNNWAGTLDTYYEFTESEFRKHHLNSGQWVVVLKTPSPPPLNVSYVKWW